ncbi:unnamed protein product [Vitrella brassicaformis CCMP3155]|uniref:asparagine synthase (glutamine-hydrolyzing) n=2 Tax=Vitrella brassicaformis TaxID=1169539 RepID=A0A0G4GYX5_VITBC|nr:unnamed protein product [Vitrella brassicaformis CCMP3155]|eukprot:CEM36405.1 unnamed protein product [Vitrella brassicaformis CCMP3155]
MCGIFAILMSTMDESTLRARALELSKRIRHRGPDWSGIHVQSGKNGTLNAICHERLSIVDPFSGKQPLFDVTGKVCVSVNGEIYNHMELRKELDEETVSHFRTQSDCEPIAHLYKRFGESFVAKLDGMFAFIVSDAATGEFMAARDPLGICPLYIGHGPDGSVMFGSEMKVMWDACNHFEVFPPGHIYSSKLGGFKRWYHPSWFPEDSPIPTAPLDLDKLKDALEKAVEKRLMSDVPFGVLLSGGLDSSLVASIASRILDRQRAQQASSKEYQSKAWFPRLHSFSIGLPDSPDLAAAQKVADFLGTVHHGFTFELQEGLDSLKDVIYHLETYDVTTIRASTPMYFLARKIKSMGVKMVLSGEGADEVFGGYLYFHKAPNREELHRETQRKLKLLHMYDLLRANKSTQAWGLEARVPFLDKEFLEVAMHFDPQEKMCVPGKRIEKWPIRAAFAEGNYLPDDILWRQKEQFSDGVGYSWIDGLKDYAEKQISDHQFQGARFQFPYNTPQTKEAYLFRQIFHSFFPQHSATQTVPGGPSIACSTPAAILWDQSFSANADASGRAMLGVHLQSKEFDDAKKASATSAAADQTQKGQPMTNGTPAAAAAVHT